MSFHGSEIGDNKPLKRLKSVPFLTVIASKEHQFFLGNPLVNPRSQSANSALTWRFNHLGGIVILSSVIFATQGEFGEVLAATIACLNQVNYS